MLLFASASSDLISSSVSWTYLPVSNLIRGQARRAQRQRCRPADRLIPYSRAALRVQQVKQVFSCGVDLDRNGYNAEGQYAPGDGSGHQIRQQLALSWRKPRYTPRLAPAMSRFGPVTAGCPRRGLRQG